MPMTDMTIIMRARHAKLLLLPPLVLRTLGMVDLDRAVRLSNWIIGFVVFEWRTYHTTRRPWYRRLFRRTHWAPMDCQVPKIEVIADAD